MAFRPSCGRRIQAVRGVRTARDLMRRHMREEGKRIIDLCPVWNMHENSVYRRFYEARPFTPQMIEGFIELLKLDEFDAYELRLQAAIERVARILGQDLTSQNPVLNTRLPDGSRVAVVGAPSSITGPTFTVRKFNRWFTSDELIESGTLPTEIRDAVVRFIGERKNGIISGGTGSGKTTLMKALLDHIPLHERLIVIESMFTDRSSASPRPSM